MVQRINVLGATNKEKDRDHQDDHKHNVSTREIISQFASGTSIHGIPHIQSSRKCYSKTFWIVAFITATMFLTYGFVTLIDKYLQYDIRIASIQERKAVAFPDVTLCPYRAMDISVIKSFHNRFRETDNFFEAFFLKNASTAIPEFEKALIKTLRPFKKLYETFGSISAFNVLLKKSTLFTMMKPSVLRSGLIPNWEMTVRCRFQGDPCEQSNITFKTFQHPVFHKCMTIQTPKFINTGGIERGLEIVGIYGSKFVDWTANITWKTSFFMIGITEEGSALSGEQGVKVIVHPQNTDPVPVGEGYNVPPGSSAHIGVKVKEALHLHRPYGKCSEDYPKDISYWYDTKKYRLMNCLQKCFQNKILEKCQCISGKLPLPEKNNNYTFQFCENIFDLPVNCSAPNVKPDISCLGYLQDNKEHSRCAQDVFDKSSANRNIMEECDCYIPCNYTGYDMHYSVTEWPLGPELDITYYRLMDIDNFMEEFNKTNPNALKKEMYKKHFSFENRVSGLKDLAKINVYISDTTVSRTEEMAAYTANDLLSDLGGQLGLWGGMSVLSFCEIFQFFGELFSAIFCRTEQKVQSLK